jgi:Fe-S oxidoreductase
MKELYGRYHFSLGSRPMTMTQFLKPYLENANYTLNKKVTQRFMYQDPCYLGRYLGEYDTPRDLLTRTTSRAPLEFHDHREKSVCCGQGGCFSVTSLKSSDEISRRRLAEAKEKHVTTIVTHCPSCVSKFRKTSDGMQIVDIVSFLNEAISSHD